MHSITASARGSWKKTIVWRRLPSSRSAGVLGESRSVAASGDSLEDAFAPLAVHLYVAAPA